MVSSAGMTVERPCRSISLGGPQSRLHAGDGTLQVAHPARVIDAGQHFLAVARGGVHFQMEGLQRTVEQRRTIALEVGVSASVDQRGCDQGPPHSRDPNPRGLTGPLNAMVKFYRTGPLEKGTVLGTFR